MTTGQGVLGGNMFAYCLNNPVNMVDSQGDVAIIDDALLLLLLLLVGTIETAAYVGTDVSTSSASNIGGILSDPLPAIKETYVETFVVAAVMVTVLTTPRTGSGISVVEDRNPDPYARPGQKKQEREKKEKKRKNRNFKNRSGKRRPSEPKRHTPGRDHRKNFKK